MIFWLLFSRASALDCKAFLDVNQEHSNSQWMQDWFLVHNLSPDGPNWNEDRRFIEIGSFDPYMYSNSLALERCLGWRGACVEPNPNMYENFRNHRSCFVLPHCAWSERFNSTLEITTDPIEARIKRSIDSPALKLTSSYPALCLPLQEIIDRFDRASSGGLQKKADGRRVIDALLIDAEGAEVEILQNFNFSGFHISTIIIEASARKEELEDIFFRNGFVKVAVLGGDWVFHNFG